MVSWVHRFVSLDTCYLCRAKVQGSPSELIDANFVMQAAASVYGASDLDIWLPQSLRCLLSAAQ